MTDHEPNLIGRRAALKAAAATGAAAVVWAEPTIKGLARRPAYADTTSGAPILAVDVEITGIISAADGSISDIFVNGMAQPAGGTTIGNQAYTFISNTDATRPKLRLINDVGAGTLLTMTAATYDLGPGGPAASPFLSGSARQLRFATFADGVTPGAFTLTVTIQCVDPDL